MVVPVSDYNDWCRGCHSSMVIRVGPLILLALLLAPTGLVSGPAGDAQAQQQPAGKV